MNFTVETVALNFIKQYFPECNIAFLAGSAASKNLTHQSDLDILILDESQTTSFRECFFYCDWKIEAFVYSRTSLELAFELGSVEGMPTIQQMCAQGIILRDDGSAIDLQNEAKESLALGPVAWDEEESYVRFMITDLLVDLSSSQNKKENIFIALKLFDLVNEYILRVNSRWLGFGKWMYRSLHDFDPKMCEELIAAFDSFFKEGEAEPLIHYIDQVLAPYGGRLFEGYREDFF